MVTFYFGNWQKRFQKTSLDWLTDLLGNLTIMALCIAQNMMVVRLARRQMISRCHSNSEICCLFLVGMQTLRVEGLKRSRKLTRSMQTLFQKDIPLTQKKHQELLRTMLLTRMLSRRKKEISATVNAPGARN